MVMVVMMMMMMMRMMVVMVVMTKMMIEYNTEAINQATWLDFMALSNQPKIGTIIMVLLSCQTHIYQDQNNDDENNKDCLQACQPLLLLH